MPQSHWIPSPTRITDRYGEQPVIAGPMQRHFGPVYSQCTYVFHTTSATNVASGINVIKPIGILFTLLGRHVRQFVRRSATEFDRFVYANAAVFLAQLIYKPVGAPSFHDGQDEPGAEEENQYGGAEPAYLVL